MFQVCFSPWDSPCLCLFSKLLPCLQPVLAVSLGLVHEIPLGGKLLRVLGAPQRQQELNQYNAFMLLDQTALLPYFKDFSEYVSVVARSN